MQNQDYMIQDLSSSLDKRNFSVNYQPQFNAKSEFIGIEALSRWTNSNGDNISPEIFIPLLEETGLIYDFGLQVAEKSFLCAYTMEKLLNLPFHKMAVNVSTLQLENASFLDDLEYIRKQTGISTQNLTLEITESHKLSQFSFYMIKELNKAGYGISIDDFGTGYSSFQYIMNMPLNSLKIDKSFIQNIHLQKEQQCIVTAIIDMCRHLDIPVIVEGIETKDELQYLTKHGCNSFQGFYFSKPLKENDLFKIAA
jgi:EAL domain-containing protein (putative c-di-GMP-specific phosphodiesterase class I)